MLILERYQVLEHIADGGIGSIYKVLDTQQNKTIVLKRILDKYIKNPDIVSMFKQEFHIMTKFKHPCIVQVYEYGLIDKNIPFITMEYVEGENLNNIKELNYQLVYELFIQLCQTIGFIHSRGFVHRDIKPENIKLTTNNQIKLLDLGLMAPIGTLSDGKITGTPAYIAPEIPKGGIINETTDLYAIGVLMYELLTGRKPFTGSRIEVIKAHINTKPEPLSNYRADIPDKLEKIVLKLLEKEQNKRYQTANDVLNDIGELTGKKVLTETIPQKIGYLYSSYLIGREKEIKILKSKLETLINSTPKPIFIGAPTGIGKTRLINELKIQAQLEEIPFIWVNTTETGGHAYQTAINILLQLYNIANNSEKEDYLGFVKDLIEKKHNIDNLENLNSQFIEALKNISKRTPLIIFIDDIQWIDISSMNLINLCIRTLRDTKILFIGTFRSNEVTITHPVWHTIEENLSEYITLSPLDKNLTNELLKSMLHNIELTDKFSSYIYNITSGNPFFITELLRYTIEKNYLQKVVNTWKVTVPLDTIECPSTIEQTILKRLENISVDATFIAWIASIIGKEIDINLWQSVSEMDDERFLSALDELIQNQFILKEYNKYLFPHDNIREAIYKEIPEDKKVEFHSKVAQYIEENYDLNLSSTVLELAYHYQHTSNIPKLIDYSLKAGEISLSKNSDVDAFRHFKYSIWGLENYPSYPNRDTLLLDLYEKAAQFSSAVWIDANTCLDWFKKAIDIYKQSKNSEKIFNLSLSYAITNAIAGYYTKSREVLDELDKTVKEGTIEWAVLHGVGYCLLNWYEGHIEDCKFNSDKAIEIFEANLNENSPTALWVALSWAYFWREKWKAYSGEPLELSNIEKIKKMVAEGKSDKTILWHAMTAIGARYAFTGKYNELLKWIDEVSESSRELGKIFWFECWISHSYLYGTIAAGVFDWIDTHIKRTSMSPDPYQVRLSYLFSGRYELEIGNLDNAVKHLSKFLEEEHKSPDNSMLEGYYYLGLAYLYKNDLNNAYKIAQEGYHYSIEGKLKNKMLELQFLRLLGQIEQKQSNYTKAKELYNKSLEIAIKQENIIQTAFTLIALGEVCAWEGNKQTALEYFNKAIENFKIIDNYYQIDKLTKLMKDLNLIPEEMIISSKVKDSNTEISKQLSQTEIKQNTHFKLDKLSNYDNATDVNKTIISTDE